MGGTATPGQGSPPGTPSRRPWGDRGSADRSNLSSAQRHAPDHAAAAPELKTDEVAESDPRAKNAAAPRADMVDRAVADDDGPRSRRLGWDRVGTGTEDHLEAAVESCRLRAPEVLLLRRVGCRHADAQSGQPRLPSSPCLGCVCDDPPVNQGSRATRECLPGWRAGASRAFARGARPPSCSLRPRRARVG